LVAAVAAIRHNGEFAFKVHKNTSFYKLYLIG
jgi:hypothetical protein